MLYYCQLHSQWKLMVRHGGCFHDTTGYCIAEELVAERTPVNESKDGVFTTTAADRIDVRAIEAYWLLGYGKMLEAAEVRDRLEEQMHLLREKLSKAKQTEAVMRALLASSTIPQELTKCKKSN